MDNAAFSHLHFLYVIKKSISFCSTAIKTALDPRQLAISLKLFFGKVYKAQSLAPRNNTEMLF